MNLYIRCDVCSSTYLIECAALQSVKRIAERLGWVVINGKTHCRKCAEKAQQAQGQRNP